MVLTDHKKTFQTRGNKQSAFSSKYEVSKTSDCIRGVECNVSNLSVSYIGKVARIKIYGILRNFTYQTQMKKSQGKGTIQMTHGVIQPNQ